MNRRLLVIGAGPKALAIHIRAKVLRKLGHQPPDVAIIEDSEVGANWTGSVGFTDGTRSLVTPPEKDLGFPYTSADRRVDLGLARYSWHAFKVANGGLAEWVDGNRQLPTHSEFARYLQWVSCESGASITQGKVAQGGIVLEGEEWVVSYRAAGSARPEALRANALVITGPGEPNHLVDGQDSHFNISDGKTFWLPARLSDFKSLRNGKIAVIGSGDTAASIVVALLELLPHDSAVEIHIYCKGGIIRSRAESVGEVRWFTDPTGWSQLTVQTREEFISRTERGVFSSILKSRIDSATNVKTLPGMVREARMDKRSVRLRVQGDHSRTEEKSEPYKRAIVATGFRRWSFVNLFQDRSRFPFLDKRKWPDRWETVKEVQFSEKIRSDLSFNEWDTPKLYLPALAGLHCGPGFPNLGCLGLMSERIMQSELHPGSI